MSSLIVVAAGLALLSVISGMLGLGVAFAGVPFLGLFLPDLVHEVQPLSLLLNGVTALFALFGFARSGLVSWKPAVLLAVVTTIVAPAGAYLAQITNPTYLWAFYFVAVAFLAYRMFLPEKPAPEPTAGLGQELRAQPLLAAHAGAATFSEPAGWVPGPGASAAEAAAMSEDTERHPTAGLDRQLRMALLLAIPISLVAAMLGVGPGFLLLPTLILLGYESKHAAAINALAVTPPSFSALLPHLATARVDLRLAAILIVVGAAGSFLGARVTSLWVPGRRLKQIFGVLIVVMTAYKLYAIVK